MDQQISHTALDIALDHLEVCVRSSDQSRVSLYEGRLRRYLQLRYSLREFSPVVIGSFMIGLNDDRSDLDIRLDAYPKGVALICDGSIESFNMRIAELEALVVRFLEGHPIQVPT